MASTEVATGSTAPAARPSWWNPLDAFDPKLARTLRERPEPDDVREVRFRIAEAFCEVVNRASGERQRHEHNRRVWGWLNGSLGLVSLVSGVVAGSVLFGQLGPAAKLVAGAAALAGGAATGTITLLKPSTEHQLDSLKYKLYEALWREAWQYLTVYLAVAPLSQAEEVLRRITERLEEISLLSPSDQGAAKDHGINGRIGAEGDPGGAGGNASSPQP
jgi:hypothetical protein